MPISTQTKTLAQTLAPNIIMYSCRTDDIILDRDAFIEIMTKNFARYKTGSIRFENPEVKGEGVIAWLAPADCILKSIPGS